MTVPMPKSPCFNNTHTDTQCWVMELQRDRKELVCVLCFSHKTCPGCEGVSSYARPALFSIQTYKARAPGRTKPLPHKHPSSFLMLWVLWAPLLSEILEVTINEAMWTHTAVHCAALGSGNTQNINNVFNGHRNMWCLTPAAGVSVGLLCAGQGIRACVWAQVSWTQKKSVLCVLKWD